MRTQGKMKILHLPIKRKWFNLIATGEKKIEYREYKLHWIRRLTKLDEYYLIRDNLNYEPLLSMRDDYNEVHIRNGYQKSSPFLRVRFKKIISDMCEDKNTPYYRKLCFHIYLGEILEIRNWKL